MTTPNNYIEDCVKKKRLRYERIHWWMRKNHGVPSICESETCSGESQHFEWALKKGRRHGKNRNNYLRLCKKCHTKYDWDEERQRKWENTCRLAHTPEADKKKGKSNRGKPMQIKLREILLKATSRPVFQINDCGDVVKEWPSRSEASRQMGVHISAIGQALKMGYKSAGYYWKDATINLA